MKKRWFVHNNTRCGFITFHILGQNNSQMLIQSWESTTSCVGVELGRPIGINSCFILVIIGLSVVSQSDKVYTSYLGLRHCLFGQLADISPSSTTINLFRICLEILNCRVVNATHMTAAAFRTEQPFLTCPYLRQTSAFWQGRKLNLCKIS